MTIFALTLAAAALSTGPHQEHQGLIAGTIVDAGSGAPLAEAVLVLEPRDGGLLPSPGDPFPTLGVRRTVSDVTGVYAFTHLPPGPYVLRVDRVGYRSARVEVDLEAGSTPRLRLRLDVDPIPLERLVVSAEPSEAGRIPVRDLPPESAPLRSDEIRRDRFLEPDVRLVTGADVATAHTFPQEDLLRAVQRLPGISTRDDYSAELWTRGSAWGLTRVYLDDLPLFDPFFAGGTLTALGPGAAGGLFSHPGARPVSMGEGAAGVIGIRTRDADDLPGLPAVLDIGLGTAQATLERRLLDGRAGLLFSGRRSWFDRIWNTFVDDGHDPEGPFDYVARSSFWRGDVKFDSGVSLGASLYDGGDELGGNAAGLLAETSGAWGNRVSQLALSIPRRGHALRIVAGQSAYEAHVGQTTTRVEPVDPGVVVLRPADSRIRYRTIRMDWTPSGGAEGTSVGIEAVRQSLAATGAAATRSTDFLAGEGNAANDAVSAWVSHRRSVLGDVDVEGGLRAQIGSEVRGAGAVRLSPHIAVRVQPAPNTYLSVAARRSIQHLQQVAPAGAKFGGGHTFGHAWSLAGPATPVVETDILTAGVERRLEGSVWLALNGWFRRVDGMTVQDPTAGPYRTAPVEWVSGENRATGAELQLRRWVGPVTGSATYSWVRSIRRAKGIDYASPADRTHAFDAMVAWRARPTLRWTGSFRAWSGAPYRRVLSHPCLDSLGRTDDCDQPDPWAYRGPAGDLRSPSFASLDLGLDWARRNPSWGWGLSLRVNNVLGRSNLGGYRRTECPAGADAPTCVHGSAPKDVFYHLLPGPLPLATARVWF